MAGFQVDVVTGIRNITGLLLEAVLPYNHDFVNFGAEARKGLRDRARGEVVITMKRLLAVVAFFVPLAAVAQGQLNLYCSSPNTTWCQGMAVGFEKATGTRVAVVQKATGEMFAQIKAEAANPKGDIWWAGAADAYLQAAEEGLLDEYRSPNVAQLYDWAQRITALSNGRVSGVYGGIIALGYNTELMSRKKLPIPKCWKDLTNPVYKGEVMLGNPNSSGTAYLMLATLVQVFGEDEAFSYLRAVHPNVNQYARSGIGPMTAITRGETASLASISCTRDMAQRSP